VSFIKEISEDLKSIDHSTKVLRKGGLTGGLVLGLLGGITAYRHFDETASVVTHAWILWAIAALLFTTALLIPRALKPVNWFMVLLSQVIGWVVTRISLFFIFFGVFFPVGILLKFAGKDSMRRKIDKNATTYWIDRPDEPFDPARCRRLF